MTPDDSALLRPLLLAQMALTWSLVGLIWTVQLVQYPLFTRVGREAFRAYHEGHSQRITWVVAPLMLAELAVVVGLLFLRSDRLPTISLWAGAALLAVVWLATAFLQVPRHGELAQGFDDTAHAFLVTSNWLRTGAWTLRGGLALWMVHRSW